MSDVSALDGWVPDLAVSHELMAMKLAKFGNALREAPKRSRARGEAKVQWEAASSLVAKYIPKAPAGALDRIVPDGSELGIQYSDLLVEHSCLDMCGAGADGWERALVDAVRDSIVKIRRIQMAGSPDGGLRGAANRGTYLTWMARVGILGAYLGLVPEDARRREALILLAFQCGDDRWAECLGAIGLDDGPSGCPLLDQLRLMRPEF